MNLETGAHLMARLLAIRAMNMGLVLAHTRPSIRRRGVATMRGSTHNAKLTTSGGSVKMDLAKRTR